MTHKTKFSIDVDKVRSRADFFIEEAERQLSTPQFSGLALSLTRPNAEFLAEAYFLVTEAYKARRLGDGRLTQPPKIAAITCLAVASLNPIRPTKPSSPSTRITYANPLFALRLSCDIVEHPFDKQPWNRVMWFADGLRNTALKSLERYVDEVRTGARTIGSEYELDLKGQDLRMIEDRIGFFTVLGDLKVYKVESTLS